MASKDEKDNKESLDSSDQKNTGIQKYGEAELTQDSMIGMSKVDMADIRPPQILLIQKSSDEEAFRDPKGTKPSVGQFFHTGKMEIMDSFECYFLFAAKGKYVNKIKPEEGEKDQYRVIGVMWDDLSTFGMVFRSSSLFCLSPLFTAALSQKRPMFSIRVKIETKSLENDKGKWWVPVCRVLEPEEDFGKLKVLSDLAKRYDRKAEEIVRDDPEEGKGENEDDILF